MAVDMINAQSKIYIPPASGAAETGSGRPPARVTIPSPGSDNPVVQLFPGNNPSASEAASRSAEKVSAMVEDLQASLEMLQQKHTQLNFSVHDKTDRVMVRVTDQDTGEVIREIPSEEFLDLAARLQEMVGLMFDTKI